MFGVPGQWGAKLGNFELGWGTVFFWQKIDPITTDFDGNRGDRFPPMRPRFCSGSRGPGALRAKLAAEIRAYMAPPHLPNSKFPNLAPHGPGTPKIGFLVSVS